MNEQDEIELRRKELEETSTGTSRASMLAAQVVGWIIVIAILIPLLLGYLLLLAPLVKMVLRGYGVDI